MDIIKQENESSNNDTKDNTSEDKPKLCENLKFQCSVCKYHERYDYFGMNPSYMKNYILLEDSYVIEDPFLPPRQGEYIILGANCSACNKAVCKDQRCSIYFDKTICINCAKDCLSSFPKVLQDKLNKVT